MIRRPPRSTLDRSSAASDVYKRQVINNVSAGTYNAITVKDANGCTKVITPGVTIANPPAITASASAGTIACNNGTTSITITASGGTGALQYSLDGITYQAGNVIN